MLDLAIVDKLNRAGFVVAPYTVSYTHLTLPTKAKV